MEAVPVESQNGPQQDKLEDSMSEDTPEEAEKIAMEVLSPKPPPDDIGPDELVAFVVSGGQLPPSQVNKSEPISSTGVEELQKLTCPLPPSPSSSEGKTPPAVSSTFGKLVLNGTSMPLWRRLLPCVHFSPSSSSTSEECTKIVKSKNDRRFSSPRLSRLCVCLRRGESVRNSSYKTELEDRCVITNHQDGSAPAGGDIEQAADTENTCDGNAHVQIVTVQESADQQQTDQRHLLPPLLLHDTKKKCFVIDLDETLVHSSFANVSNPDFKIRVDIAGRAHQVFVLKRPFVDLFLQKMAPLYECVLFTASLSAYADPVTDLLDPDGVFRHRLFRESCCFFNGNYVKDLSQLGRDVNQTVILDNSPVSYLFHPSNAVHILTWFDNPDDRALLDLIAYFEELAEAQNVPQFLANNPPPASAIAGIPHLYQPVFHHITVAPPMHSPYPTSSELTYSMQRHPPTAQSGYDSPITSVLHSYPYALPYCTTVIQANESASHTVDKEDNNQHPSPQDDPLIAESDKSNLEVSFSRISCPQPSEEVVT